MTERLGDYYEIEWKFGGANHVSLGEGERLVRALRGWRANGCPAGVEGCLEINEVCGMTIHTHCDQIGAISLSTEDSRDTWTLRNAVHEMEKRDWHEAHPAYPDPDD